MYLKIKGNEKFLKRPGSSFFIELEFKTGAQENARVKSPNSTQRQYGVHIVV
jgi:hypothetical protein